MGPQDRSGGPSGASRLPAIPLPRDTVLVGGVEVEYRSLSRAEALKASTGFRSDPDAGETFILSCGMDISEDEALAWRNATPGDEAGKLIDGIIFLSGLAERPVIPEMGNGGQPGNDPGKP